MSRWSRKRETRTASGRWLGDQRFELGRQKVADVQRWA